MSIRPALLLTVALSPAFATAWADIAIEGGGFRTPSTTVIDGGYETPAASALGGGFLTPAATGLSFAQRLQQVQQGLRLAAVDAQCAPAGLKLRLHRRLRRTIALLGALARAATVDPQAPSMAGFQSRLGRSAELLRGYCATVRTADVLASECAQHLLAPCPTASN